MTHRALILVFIMVLTGVTAVFAQDVGTNPSRQKPAATGIFALIPSDATTDHVLQTASGPIAYEATAGTLDLFNRSGRVTAKIFYTAYVAKDRKPGRPVTFGFNGGPGAASAYLHLGLVGPKIVEFGPQGEGGATPALVDNPESWLAFTDLVLIDPVGTGWSRATSESTARQFYGVSADAESLAKAIALYVQKNNRIDAPKYLLGESYGGFRAAKVAVALKQNQGILASGLVLVSPFLEGRFLATAGYDPVSAALLLPSLAAANAFRTGTFDKDRQREVERFAMNDYLVGLASPPPPGEESANFYGHIAALTGLEAADVAGTRGFLGGLYDKAMGGAGRIVSPYDAAHSAPDAYPQLGDSRNDDPVLDGYTRAFGAALASYARHDLGFASEMTYTLLNNEVNRRWDWSRGRRSGSRRSASAASDLADLLSVIPSFRIMIAHGYSDAITPYGVSRYVLDHLAPGLGEGRTALKVYRGGHMFYTDPASRRAFHGDMRSFYEDPES